MDVEVYGELCGYDFAFRRACRRKKFRQPPRRPLGVIFGERMPYDDERLVVLASRLAPALEQSAENWRGLGCDEVVDALARIVRLLRLISSAAQRGA